MSRLLNQVHGATAVCTRGNASASFSQSIDQGLRFSYMLDDSKDEPRITDRVRQTRAEYDEKVEYLSFRMARDQEPQEEELEFLHSYGPQPSSEKKIQ